MLRNLSILNAIVLAIAIFALLVPASEARLGKNKESNIFQGDDDCRVPCAHGGVSMITVCHKRGDMSIDICTNESSFAEHKELGDTCGYCDSS